MESADLQLQHQLQLQQLNGYFSLLETKLASKVPRTQDWNSTTVLKDSSGDTDTTESISRSKECWSSPLFSNTIGQESFIPESANQLFPANNKVEMPDFFPKQYTEMIHIPSSVNGHESFSLSSKHYPHYPYDLGENLWLNHFSLDRDITQLQLSAGAGCHNPQASPSAVTSNGFISHVFPSTIISSASDLCASLVSRSPNLQALDLLTSTYHDESFFSQSSHDMIHGKLSETTFMGHDGMPELIKDASPSNSSNKMPRLVNGVTRTKRPGSFTESKETRQDFRKSRSRSSCPPLKVRKEKLGDRIQALQKMVAPFGKTDTASVLTEAIGYIQFLHDRVQTLTTPYRNSSTTQAGSSKEDKIEESKRNLRRRGLCLVPLPYASYFNSYDGSMETNST
ncbi:transcription factor bHLH110-like [Pistacia vera]|uniref:transcription factor bHLH110-like n=1 Tax=Pistacia vera TaxID=55513 RepID=UPI0012638082|nr:transcription factor bHLH110-like [Pistacia vera]